MLIIHTKLEWGNLLFLVLYVLKPLLIEHLPTIHESSVYYVFRTLQGHGHWVNVLALNTDYVVRTGAFDPKVCNLQCLILWCFKKIFNLFLCTSEF